MSTVTLQNRLDTFLDRLDKLKSTAADRWIARCPAHDDKGPSLSVRLVDDRILVHCFAGCDAIDVVNAVDLELADLFEGRPEKHAHKPARSRIPPRELLTLLQHEITVACLIAADFLAAKIITEKDWNRLADAAARIGSARHG